MLRRGPAIGVTGAPLQVNFAKVREHLGTVGAAIAANVTAERLTALGITVVKAAARFTDRDTVDGRRDHHPRPPLSSWRSAPSRRRPTSPASTASTS